MRLNEIDLGGAAAIEGYGPGFFRAGGAVHRGAILVQATGAAGWAGYGDAGPLLELAGQIDVLILGTGAEIAPVPGALRSALEAAGIGVEIMATPTAARSYNLLLAEGRRVAAALLPV